MRVLITGASGFIGRQCAELLAERGAEVHAVSRNDMKGHRGATIWHRLDLLDRKSVDLVIGELRPTHLLHLAWCTSPGDYWNSRANVEWLQSSLHLVRSFAMCNGRRFVGAGSCAEYDWAYGCCSEHRTPLRPASLYGVCKHACQMVLDAFSQEAHMSSAWGRVFFLYGPHERPDRLVPSVIRALMGGEHARCTHGNQIRDFLHVRDAADAFISLLESDVHGAVNIASGQPVALSHIVHSIADKLGARHLVRLGAIPTPPHEAGLLVADVGRLANEVGWRPTIDLHAGLEQVICWWKSQEMRLEDEQAT